MIDLKDSQNFLQNSLLVEKLIMKSGISVDDVVMDIGAGKGIITECLTHACKKVVAIELDKNLYTALRTKFISEKKVELINADFLTMPLPSFPYKVFANIPFNQTSNIVTKLMFSANHPIEANLIMQKEAAYRFMGRGEGYMLTNLLKPFYSIQLIYEFEKSDFVPKPSIDIVLLKFSALEDPAVPENDKYDYFDFIVYLYDQQKPSVRLRLAKLFTGEQFKRIAEDLGFSQMVSANSLDITMCVKLYQKYRVLVSEPKKRLVEGAYTRYKTRLIAKKTVTRTKIRQK